MDAHHAEQNEAKSEDVTAETLAADDAGRCELDSGQGLALDTVRRITCDSSLLRIMEDDAGNPLDIGRKTRAVPPAMRRAWQARDSGGSAEGLPRRNRETGEIIDATSWIIPGDTLDYGIAVEGLMCKRERESRLAGLY